MHRLAAARRRESAADRLRRPAAAGGCATPWTACGPGAGWLAVLAFPFVASFPLSHGVLQLLLQPGRCSSSSSATSCGTTSASASGQTLVLGGAGGAALLLSPGRTRRGPDGSSARWRWAWTAAGSSGLGGGCWGRRWRSCRRSCWAWRSSAGRAGGAVWKNTPAGLWDSLRQLEVLVSYVNLERTLTRGAILGIGRADRAVLWSHWRARAFERRDWLLAVAGLTFAAYFAAPTELSGGGFVEPRLALFALPEPHPLARRHPVRRGAQTAGTGGGDARRAGTPAMHSCVRSRVQRLPGRLPLGRAAPAGQPDPVCRWCSRTACDTGERLDRSTPRSACSATRRLPGGTGRRHRHGKLRGAQRLLPGRFPPDRSIRSSSSTPSTFGQDVGLQAEPPDVDFLKYPGAPDCPSITSCCGTCARNSARRRPGARSSSNLRDATS